MNRNIPVNSSLNIRYAAVSLQFAALTLATFSAAITPVSAQERATKPNATAPSLQATVYSGGDIITMRGKMPEYAEALVVQDGKIVFVGSKNTALKKAGSGAKRVDLQGHTLAPGFIDAHGHFVYAEKNLLDADLVGVKSIAELLARLKAHAATLPKDAWVVGMGYRIEDMAEKRHPTIEELDSISSTNPVLAVDGSGHHGSINKAIMTSLNLTADTPDPEGGVYFRKEGSREFEGHVAEEGLNHIRAARPAQSPELTIKGVAKAAKVWAENGETTACEMGLGLGQDDIEVVQTIINKRLLPLDLVMYAKCSASSPIIDAAYKVSQQYSDDNRNNAGLLLSARPDLDKRYINRVRLAGIKFWMDGSVETMMMSRPFTINPTGVTEKEYKGMRTQSQEELEETLRKYWNTNLQFAAHAIGDEANEQYLKALEKVAREKGGIGDRRPIFQHAQFLRPDQLPRIKSVGGITSFTAGGIYPVGDYISRLVGPERVGWLGPANSVVKTGIVWTINHDMPAGVSPSLLYAMWNVVNRKTKSGAILSPNERVTAYEALRSVTINGAHQIKEEKKKGSLEVGKLADMVILDKNPLKVAPMAIKDIVVLATLKEGNIIYRRPATAKSATLALPESSIADVHEHADLRPLTSSTQRTLGALLNSAR
jgi:hypothetical protein